MKKHPSFAAITVSWLVVMAVLFGFFHLVERYWLDWADMPVIRALHLVRGISASAVTAFLAAFYLVKRSPAVSLLGGVLSRPPAGEGETVRRRAVWFIHMRWIALLVAVSAVLIACFLTSLLPRENLVPLIICLFILFALNIFYAFRVSRTSNPYRFLILQAAADLILLTLLLHYSGGIENPLYLAYLFHVIIGGIVLSRRDAILVTGSAAILFVGMAAFHGTGASFDPLFAAGRVLPFLAALGFTAYFTILLSDQIRRGQSGLIQAGKLAAIGELAGRIAHEINNPIGIISARAKLLLEDESLSPKTRAMLEKIDQQSQRIAELVQGLLTFSRPSLGAKGPLNLGWVVDRTLDLVLPEVEGAGVRIEKRLAVTAPIRGNANEMQQILLNLIKNAVDGMPGGGLLKIETREDGDGFVELAVADTGEGIPRDVMPQIFDPFFTTKEEGKGTGLGLSITHGLVRSHDGRIEVESEEGIGTVVKIRFPVPRAGEERQTHAQG